MAAKPRVGHLSVGELYISVEGSPYAGRKPMIYWLFLDMAQYLRNSALVIAPSNFIHASLEAL
jgi:hypothetical protein